MRIRKKTVRWGGETMQTLNKIFTRFKQLKYTPYTGEIAFDALAHALEKDETILKLVEGFWHNSVGLIIATDLRIFFIGLNRFNKTSLLQINYNDISSIDFTEPKLISSEVTITAKENSLTIKGCDYQEAKVFVELIRMLTLYNPVSKAC